jgi:hypothetical protein
MKNQDKLFRFTRFVNLADIVGSSICFRLTLRHLTSGPIVIP